MAGHVADHDFMLLKLRDGVYSMHAKHHSTVTNDKPWKDRIAREIWQAVALSYVCCFSSYAYATVADGLV